MKYKLHQKVVFVNNSPDSKGKTAFDDTVEIPASAVGISINVINVYYVIITYLMEVR